MIESIFFHNYAIAHIDLPISPSAAAGFGIAPVGAPGISGTPEAGSRLYALAASSPSNLATLPRV